MPAKTTPFQQFMAEAAQRAVRDTDKIAGEFERETAPFAAVIIHKHPGIVG
jgi:hypothetical protein